MTLASLVDYLIKEYPTVLDGIKINRIALVMLDQKQYMEVVGTDVNNYDYDDPVRWVGVDFTNKEIVKMRKIFMDKNKFSVDLMDLKK